MRRPHATPTTRAQLTQSPKNTFARADDQSIGHAQPHICFGTMHIAHLQLITDAVRKHINDNSAYLIHRSLSYAHKHHTLRSVWKGVAYWSAVD